MPFDVNKLLGYCIEQIQHFTQAHLDETFYAFAIDADMLCFNSNEEFARTLAQYKAEWQRQTRNITCLEEMTAEDWRDEKLVGVEVSERTLWS